MEFSYFVFQTSRLKRLTVLFLLCCFWLPAVIAQRPDSTLLKADSSSMLVKADSIGGASDAFFQNKYLNTQARPVSMLIRPRKAVNTDAYFYILVSVVLIFGIAKAAYSRYFANLFRVFFNSSLRQSQLTDQLVQDQLPSLIFNLLFVFAGGLYLYFLMRYFGILGTVIDWRLMGICVLLFAAIYFVKYITLKFTGWITGFRQEADIYTFIIFLINKIIGICLLPLIIVIAFTERQVSEVFVFVSFILIGLLLLMRFFRSYGLLQTRVKVSRFHFFLYIFSVEILPLFIIYKGAVLFFNNNW